LSLQLRDGLVHQHVNRIVEAEKFSRHADARAAQGLWIEEARVVRLRFAATRLRRGIARVNASERVEQRGGVGNGARHRACGVLAVRNRDDAGATDETERGLDTDK